MEYISIMGAIISSLAALFALLYYKRNHRLQTLESIRNYEDKLRVWAISSLNVIVSAEFLCNVNPQIDLEKEYFDKRESLEKDLSSLIDQGRWFIPNEAASGIDNKWPSAYQGFRSPMLDDLVEIYRLIGTIKFINNDENLRIKRHINTKRRDFVSHVFEELNPRRSRKFLESQFSYINNT